MTSVEESLRKRVTELELEIKKMKTTIDDYNNRQNSALLVTLVCSVCDILPIRLIYICVHV